MANNPRFISAEEGYALSRLPQYQGVSVAHPDGGVVTVTKRQAAAIKASRGKQKRGLMERMAQAGANRAFRAEIEAAQIRRHGAPMAEPGACDRG